MSSQILYTERKLGTNLRKPQEQALIDETLDISQSVQRVSVVMMHPQQDLHCYVT